MSRKHKLDLLNNSVSYFREAVSYAQQDEPDTNQWKFAIVNVVQAMELAFKERIRRVHPVLIWESVDKKDKSVSMRSALARLTDPTMGGIAISTNDQQKIIKAVDLRNELIHFEFDHEHDHIEGKFAEIFSFLIFFYREHLEMETSEFVDEAQHQRIIRIVRARAELKERARAYIKAEGFIDVWICPACDESTFVASDHQCCFCHHKENVVECATCGREALSSELIDTSDLLDWDWDEGRVILIESYGLEHSACPSCIDEYKEKLEQLRRAQYDEDMAMDAR